jgi:hypothetical protein
MEDIILILNRLNEIEEAMSNISYQGETLDYSPEFNQKEAIKIFQTRTEKKLEKLVEDKIWTKLLS